MNITGARLQSLGVIVHVPHASTFIPPDIRPTLLLDDQQLEHELAMMTDWHTDELSHLPANIATTVRFPVSRLVVDPERFVDDEQEPMAPRGMGVIYTRTSSGGKLRGEVTPEHRQHLLDRFYHPHHAALNQACDRLLKQHEHVLVIDAHSFRDEPLPREPDQRPDRPPICIGTDAFHTPDWLKDLVVGTYQRHWRVEVNWPFAGALTPSDYYLKDKRIWSVMIEINRGLYADSRTGGRSWFAYEQCRERNLRCLHAIINALRRPLSEPARQ